MRRSLFALAVATAAVFAGTARADGLPVVDVDVGATGVTVPASHVRYVTFPLRRQTLVARVERDGGRVAGSHVLRGRFTIPAVAYDGSAAGLSADAETLVLVRPRTRFPQPETTFAILDAERLRLRDVVTLRGDFSLDALSPSGSSLYLIEYVSPRDPTRYRVRAYDLRAGRLLRDPVIDPRTFGDAMRGLPITRATSPDGRWAYTLYDGAGKHPFVHALDTATREARCIDLHWLAGRKDLMELRFAATAGGTKLTVLAGEEPVAFVNTRSFRASEPAEPAPVQPKPALERPDAGVSWPVAAFAAVAVALAAVAGPLAVVRRRRRPALR